MNEKSQTRFKAYRESIALTQSDLVRVMGCSKGSACNWEKGVSEPTGAAKKLFALVIVFTRHPKEIRRMERIGIVEYLKQLELE